jgi:hypothetical protein
LSKMPGQEGWTRHQEKYREAPLKERTGWWVNFNNLFDLAQPPRLWPEPNFPPGSTNPRWLATLRSPEANFLHASGVQISSPKGLRGHLPQVERSDTRGHPDPVHRRTLKACEEIPAERWARPEGLIRRDFALLTTSLYTHLPQGVTRQFRQLFFIDPAGWARIDAHN